MAPSGGNAVKPTKPKSLGQIAFEQNHGLGYGWRTLGTGCQKHWDTVARAVEREVLRRQKAKPEKLWVKGSKGWFLGEISQ